MIEEVFNANNYIEKLGEHEFRCHSPEEDDYLRAVIVYDNLTAEKQEEFLKSINKMLDEELISPKFYKVIVAVLGL